MKILKNFFLGLIISIFFGCGNSIIEVKYLGNLDNSFPKISKWEELPIKLNRPKNNISCVLSQNKVYVIGGDALSVWLSDVEEIDIVNKTSKLINPLSFNRSALGSVKVGNNIYSFGGYNGTTNKWLNNLEILDLTDLKWSKGKPMNSQKSAFGITTYENNIYIGGGSLSKESFTNKFEVFDTKNDLFLSKSDMLESKSEISLVSAEYGSTKEVRIYSIGGLNQKGVLNSIDEYNIKTDKWRFRNKMSIGRSAISSVSYGSNIFIMGGYDKDFNILDTIEVFNTNLNKVKKLNNLPEHLSNFCSFIYKDEIYILGGRTKTGLSNLIRKSKIEKEN